MASKRKKDNAETNPSTPAAKIMKSDEVTRSGRVRKKPAKFTDVAPEEEEEDMAPAAPMAPKSVPSTPNAPKSARHAAPTMPVMKTEPLNSPVPVTFQSPVAARGKSPRAVAVLSTPAQVDVKSRVLSTSPDSAEDTGKSSTRGGRARKKSAKVLEMEEFEEAERKTNTKKPAPAEPIKKLVPEPPPPAPQEVLPPKKAYKGPPLMTAALAAKIASSTPGLPLKMKDVAALLEPQAVPVKKEVVSPVRVKMEPTTPVKSKSGGQVSPRSVLNTIRLDQASEQDKGSVIKLLLSSPTQATNPVLSTKSVAGTSPPVEKPPPSSKKKSKGKKGAKVSEASPPAEMTNLKQALSTPSSVPMPVMPQMEMSVDPNLVKQELPMSIDSQQQALKMKFVLSPEAAPTIANMASESVFTAPPLKTEPIKTEPMSPPPKSASKSKKSKKAMANEAKAESETKLSPQMVTPGVVHVQPSTSGLITDDQHLPPKKKKMAKIKIENVEEPEKNRPFDYDLDIDLSTLDTHGNDSLMEMGDDDGLMMSEEDMGRAKPLKSAKKKKGKVKYNVKKGITKLGELSTHTDSELVMDFERMNKDDKKKKKSPKVVSPETEQAKKKRAPTAYMMWCAANRARVVHDNPGIDFSTISKTLGEMWSGLSDKDKMMWKRKAKKAGGKGSTLIQTGKAAAAALAAKQQAQALASLHAEPIPAIPVRHGGHNPNAARATAAMTAAMLTKAAKQVVEDAPVKGFGADPFDVAAHLKIHVHGFGADPVDVAAHLKIVGESLSIIGMRLQEHRGLIAVQGSLSVLLDSMLCAMGPLLCLTNQMEELNGCSHQTHMKTLDNIAYIMPGL